jgi:hypothetical protein
VKLEQCEQSGYHMDVMSLKVQLLAILGILGISSLAILVLFLA